MPFADRVPVMARLRPPLTSVLTIPALVCGALVAASVLHGQGNIDLTATCPSCRIELTTRVRFQSLWRDGGLPHRPFSVSRFARNEWLVVDQTSNLVYRFGPTGEYRGILGRKGGGPGEFTQPSLALSWPGNSTSVFDQANARLTVFGPDGLLTRSLRWDGPAIVRAAVTDDGGFLISSRIGTRFGFGMPLHLFDARAHLTSSFGNAADIQVLRPSDVPILRLPSRVQLSKTFWSIRALSPRLERWNASGEMVESWDLPMRDFRPVRPEAFRGPGGEEFYFIEPLPDGTLLVGLVFRDARHLDALGPPKVVDGREVRVVENYGRFFDTRLLVLDPRDRTLVTVDDVDEYVIGNLGGGRFWAISAEGENGKLVIVDIEVGSKPQSEDLL